MSLPVARVIPIEPLQAHAYANFGNVLEAGPVERTSAANQGTARRTDHLADLTRSRPDARWNVCSFRCAPRDVRAFTIELLEKHPCSTQVFIPMNASRYLVVVAEAARDRDAPEPTTIRAFLATGRQGITYHPGIWHHPLLAVDHETDFICVVSEDGTRDDCVVSMLGPEHQRVVSLR